MRAQLEKLLTKAEAAHDKNQTEYTNLRKEREAVEKKMRTAKAKASVSANEVAALKKTLDGMPAEAPA